MTKPGGPISRAGGTPVSSVCKPVALGQRAARYLWLMAIICQKWVILVAILNPSCPRLGIRSGATSDSSSGPCPHSPACSPSLTMVPQRRCRYGVIRLPRPPSGPLICWFDWRQTREEWEFWTHAAVILIRHINSSVGTTNLGLSRAKKAAIWLVRRLKVVIFPPNQCAADSKSSSRCSALLGGPRDKSQPSGQPSR